MNSLELFLIVDKDGDFEVGTDLDQASERFDENIGGSGPRRVVQITVSLDLPEIEEVTLTVPKTAGEISVKAE